MTIDSLQITHQTARSREVAIRVTLTTDEVARLDAGETRLELREVRVADVPSDEDKRTLEGGW